ncbi:choline/ethanolamine kinase isoform X4 [Anopheles cruzii]|uniref:choline/ethanolamine kinase isoform X4 n=1 Tax=Anopheles cruzii TaxID=68878 RepID=UPI0022EC8B46|nr:choline/ethanolamine kinase isoform X4 [Anopheles cruzii]
MTSNLIAKVAAERRTGSLKQQLLEASSPSEMRDIAARICRDYLTGAWKTISAEELQLKRISGGLSNFLYYVSLPDQHYYNGANRGSPRDSFSGSELCKTKPTNGNKRARKDSYTSMPEPKEVLLRIYGQTHGEHALETMLTESVVFTLLSERKLGPKLHGIFPGGRIEQYIPARSLQTAELGDPKISLKVAEKMAAIHSMKIPLSKEPDWLWNTMHRWLKGIEGTLETMDRDRANGNVAVGTDGTDGGTNVSDADRDFLAEMDLAGEVKWLRSLIASEDFPVVFCHNDLQEGNILLRQDEPTTAYECNSVETFDESTQLDSHFSGILISNGIVPCNDPLSHGNGTINLNRNSRKRSLENDHIVEHDLDSTRDSVLSGNSQPLSETASSVTDSEPELMIIDFEYCAYNYRGFDLANHFLEWTFDYSNGAAPYFFHKLDQYPTYEQQEKFITQYLNHLSSSGDEDDSVAGDGDEVSEAGSNADEVEQIRREVQCFTMVSHLFWSLWAIVNVYQQIEFGYMEYAVCRLKQYRLAKKFYTETMGNGSPKGGGGASLMDPEK